MQINDAAARRNQSGMALIVAITMLAIFVVFGTAFVTQMGLEVTETTLEVRETRARILAESGITAAVTELQRAYRQDAVNEAVGHKTYQFPTFALIQSESGRTFQEMEDAEATATVAVVDENAKVNLNHAPPSVISEVLGVDSVVARQIAQSLPAAGEGGQWLHHLDDLVLRGLLTPEIYAAIPRERVTTSTVIDHDNPTAYLNVNSATPEVLAAITGVPPEVATTLAAQEFATVEELGAAVGDPSLFRMRPGPDSVDSYSSALTTESRCFRIVSEGYYVARGLKATALVEAVILFDDAGGYRILEWRAENVTMPPTEAADPPLPETAEEAVESTPAPVA